MSRMINCCALVLIVVASVAAANAEDADLARIFAKRGVKGTIIIRSLDGSVAFVHNEARARERFIPASTFKIPNTLIALEEKAIADEKEVIKWDGRPQRVAEWNKDHTLQSAFPVSCVWFYQELASRIGKEKYQRHLSTIGYGNADPGPDITTFWLDGDLRISAEEQIRFLERLCRADLPFQKQSLEIVRRLMVVDQTPQYTIRAKTGWALRVPHQLGWYVGYVESAGKTWLFATNLDIVQTGDERYRREITIAALRSKHIIDERGGAAAVSPTFAHIVVDSSDSRPLNPWGKAVGDLNGDGRPDLITGGQKSGGLVWYENTGDMHKWPRHLIAEGGGFSTDHEVCDLDADGDADLVSINEGLRWYENTDGRGQTWRRHDVSGIPSHDVEVADVDGDGRLDLIARDQKEWGDGSKVFVLRQDAGLTFSAPASLGVPDGEGLVVFDINGDGKPDIIVNQVWLENRNPSGKVDQWTRHVYSSSYTWPNTFIAVGDFNGDGRHDLVLSPSERDQHRHQRISWFEAPADRTTTWTEHVVMEDVQAVWHFVGAADLDGDGRTDIASAEMNQGDDPDLVSVFLNPVSGEAWRRVDVATTGSHSIRLADLNGDGRVDMFGANWNMALDPRGAPVEIWINQGPRRQ